MSAAAQAPPASEIGIPVISANRIGSKTKRGFGPGGHDLLVWTATAESGGHLSAMDLKTGQVYTHPLNHLEAYPIVFGSDGCVYTGSTSGEVLRWNPHTNEWGTVGPKLFQYPGASLNHVRSLCEGKNGFLYAGSVYGERAWLNPKTGESGKLPVIAEPGSWYVSSAEALPDGRIAFGCGHKARLIVYDPTTGQDTGQWLPKNWTEDGFILNMVVAKTVLYASHFPSGRRGAFDIASGTFLGEIPWPRSVLGNRWSLWGWGAGLDFLVVPGTDKAVAFDGKSIHQFDPKQPSLPKTLPPGRYRLHPDLALEIRHEVTTDCRVLEYDRLRTKVVRSRKPPQPKVARNLFSLGVGPDGCVYGGAYQSTELFRYDPKTRNIKNLGDHHPGWSGETFSYCVSGNEIFCLSYTNGAVVGYDPSKPWDAEVGRLRNPRRVGFLGQQVYRPVTCCVTEDGRIWAAGPAGWGTSGSGIAWIDPKSGKTESVPLAETPAEVVALPGNRLLVAWSGRVAWWDTASNKEIASIPAPVPIVSVAPLPDGRLLIGSPGEVLEADASETGKLALLRRARTPFPCAKALPHGSRAVIGGSSGFAVLNIETGTSKPICSTPLGNRWAFVVAQDAVYFHSGPRLMTAPIPGD